MDALMFILALALLGGVGYWMYKKGKGPFGDDDKSNGDENQQGSGEG